MGQGPSRAESPADAIKGIRHHNHPPIFFKGVEAALAGRYTKSEIFFHSLVAVNPSFVRQANAIINMERAMRHGAGGGDGAFEEDSDLNGDAQIGEEEKYDTVARAPDATKVLDGIPMPLSMQTKSPDNPLMDDARKDISGQDEGSNPQEKRRHYGEQEDPSAQVDPRDGEHKQLLLPVSSGSHSAVASAQPHEDDVEFTDCDAKRTVTPDISAGGTTAQPSSAGFQKLIEIAFPTGERLEENLTFFQLIQDIELVYVSCCTEKARALAMIYSELNCLWHQLTCAALAHLREARAAGRQAGGVAPPDVFLPPERLSERNGVDEDDVDCTLELYEQMCRQYLLNSSVNYGTLALIYADRLAKRGNRLCLSGHLNKDGVGKESTHISAQQQRIYARIADLGDYLTDLTWYYTERSPDSYISHTLASVLPPRTRPGRGFCCATAAATIPDSGNDTAAGNRAGKGKRHRQEASRQEVAALTRLATRLQTLLNSHKGATYLSESRTVNPFGHMVVPVLDLKDYLRLTVNWDGPVAKADIDKVGSPGTRIAGYYTQWTLPVGSGLSWDYPGGCDFLLSRALPQYFTLRSDGKASFSETPIRGVQPTPESEIKAIIDYTLTHDAADDAARAAAFTASGGTVKESKPSTRLDVHNPVMREFLCMEEYAIGWKVVMMLMAKVRQAQGRTDETRAFATSIIVQTACLRGADADRRIKFQMLLMDGGYL